MLTLNDISIELRRIAEAADSLKINGRENASIVVYITRRCDDLIRAIAEAQQASQTPQTELREVTGE